MKITVTKDDLKGVYSDNRDCPIARAVKRAVGKKEVFVTPNRVYINSSWYKLPRSADNKARHRAERITKFNRKRIWGRIIGGFTFELEGL
jgi:hypothetical protein